MLSHSGAGKLLFLNKEHGIKASSPNYIPFLHSALCRVTLNTLQLLLKMAAGFHLDP